MELPNNDLMAPLKTIFEQRKRGFPLPLRLRDATYHLCLEDTNAMLLLSYWKADGKPFPLSVRNAKENIKGCMVISFTDQDGNSFNLLERALLELEAKAQIKVVVK